MTLPRLHMLRMNHVAAVADHTPAALLWPPGSASLMLHLRSLHVYADCLKCPKLWAAMVAVKELCLVPLHGNAQPAEVLALRPLHLRVSELRVAGGLNDDGMHALLASLPHLCQRLPSPHKYQPWHALSGGRPA